MTHFPIFLIRVEELKMQKIIKLIGGPTNVTARIVPLRAFLAYFFVGENVGVIKKRFCKKYPHKYQNFDFSTWRQAISSHCELFPDVCFQKGEFLSYSTSFSFFAWVSKSKESDMKTSMFTPSLYSYPKGPPFYNISYGVVFKKSRIVVCTKRIIVTFAKLGMDLSGWKEGERLFATSRTGGKLKRSAQSFITNAHTNYICKS